MADVEAGGLQMENATGIGTGHDGCAGTGDGVHLPLPEVGGHVRMDDAVGPTCAAAQPLVVELDQIRVGSEDRPYVLVGPLHMTQVTGILDSDGIRQAV